MYVTRVVALPPLFTSPIFFLLRFHPSLSSHLDVNLHYLYITSLF